MTDSDEVERTRAAMAAAIAAHGRALGTVPDDAMLSEFIIVTHWLGMADVANNGYCVYFGGDTVPMHHAIGLLAHGDNLLAAYADDDD